VNDSLALIGATIYTSPEEEPIRDGIVLIEAGSISAVGAKSFVQLPSQTSTLDCSGSVITAGFWNSHVHLIERKWGNAGATPAGELSRQFEQMLTRYGFTAVFDLASIWENTRRLRERVESGEVAGPRIRTVGEGLLPKNPGIPTETVNFMGWMEAPRDEIAEPEESAAAARKRLAQGVDGIKLFASTPSKSTIPEAAMAAAVAEAHALGKPAFVHPNSAEDVMTAVRAGADVIAHTTPHAGPWSETLIALMKERNVALTPTLWIWKYFTRHDRVSAQDQIVASEVGQLRAWRAAGGEVLFGSDLGAVDYDPTEEYALMAEAGMSFREILASLTTAPAKRFGAEQLGRVAAGFHADLVVLKQDPSGNLRALTDVLYTFREGKILYRNTN
jgi:imidazolonepropionase-like amidohydrolase